MKSHIQNVASFRYSINNSIARLTNRPYVISEVNRSIESRFVRFCTLRIDVWSSPSESTSLRELARKLQNTHRWESSRSHFVEESVDSNDNHSHVSIDQDLSNWRSLLESFKIHIVEEVSELVVERASELVVEETCTKASEHASLKELESASLKELARKLQTYLL